MQLLKPFVAGAIEPTGRTIETDEEIIAKKEQFAELLLRENEPFKVALVLYPDDTGRALEIAHKWPIDQQVLAFQQSLKDAEGEITFLPTKADTARLAWTVARNEERYDGETRHKFLKLYAEIRGFIEKPALNVNQTNNVIQNNVMVVRDHGTDNEWESKLQNQQRTLKKVVYEHADSSGTS